VFNPARSLCGDVILVELPLAQVPEPVGQLMEPSDVSELLTELDIQSNKYTHGVLGLIAGSRKYPGAGVLTVLGSQWGGSGYIQYLGPRESTLSVMNVVVIDSLESLHPKTNVIVCGPGIDQLDGSINLLREIVLLDKTLLLDADAITLLSQSVELQSLLGGRKGLTILTPHHGEALRLAESLAIDTSESEHVWVSQIARKLKVLVAYKSAHGFIALPDGTFFFSDTTASALATAGTGDVLAGLMGSLIARHSPTTHKQLAHIAMGAVILHSLAAQLSEENSVNATAFDIAHEIRNAISILQNLGEE
jgi:hydroxyethylthiazole kinase-like uncharacterized protein yjeF